MEKIFTPAAIGMTQPSGPSTMDVDDIEQSAPDNGHSSADGVRWNASNDYSNTPGLFPGSSIAHHTKDIMLSKSLEVLDQAANIPEGQKNPVAALGSERSKATGIAPPAADAPTLPDEKPQLFPYFQPIVSIASGKIIGYEALARQRDRHNRVISAGGLFTSPTLETRRRIEYDREVRRLALQKFSALDDGSYLTINISAAWIDNLRQLNASPTLKMLDELNIDRQRIIVEISDAHADIHKLREIVRRYRQQGLRVALDDFGSGASQLERVMAIHPDIIKIDMQLFKKASKGGIASDIVHMLTRLGKRTGCQIICEGVETDAEFLFGLDCGAQFMQGFLFSPAAPEFKSPTLYERHIASLRAKFFKNTVDKAQKVIKDIDTTKTLIYRLKDALQGDFNLNELAKWNFGACNIARFYLCDNVGRQISPNFDFTASQWFTDPRKIGFNWSWRPYFFQLIALERSGDRDRIVASERYRDFDTDLLCKTLSLRLDADRILLVDIIVKD